MAKLNDKLLDGNLDVLFFPDGAFSWDGTHHVFTGIHLNAEKAAEYPDVKDHLDEIGKAVQALVNECEQDERLRVPAAKLGADLRRFLNGADLTGAALFHLAAYHLFWFKEDEEVPGRFSILVDTRLKNTIPHSTEYFRAFLEILRAYNGDPAPEVPGPATVFRAADIPDIFEDGGPCLAGSDGDASGDEGDEEYQDILGILQGSMDSADLSGLSESDQDDLQAAMQRIAGNLQALNHAVKGDAKSVPANGGKSAGKRDLGRFAGDDGRLDAFMAVAFFTEDVIFFHPEDLLWDGKYHSFANYRFNAAVLPNAEGHPGNWTALPRGGTEYRQENTTPGSRFTAQILRTSKQGIKPFYQPQRIIKGTPILDVRSHILKKSLTNASTRYSLYMRLHRVDRRLYLWQKFN